MTTDINRRAAIGLLVGGSGTLVGTSPKSRPPGIEAATIRDETINVVDFGARPDSTSDNATAFERAVERGLATGKPLLIPPANGHYATSRPLRPFTGLIGMGRQSCIAALTPADFASEKAIVHIGWTRHENAQPCQVPVRGFRILGAARRSERRSGDAASSGFFGTGMLYDEMTGPLHASHIVISHCYKGIVHGNASGHLGGTALDVSNCWYNLYWDRNTGDYRYYDSVFTGALFASYGCRGDNRIDGIDPGGISNLLLSGCHAGFSPYGFFQEDGDGTVGLVGLTLQNSSFEQIGNAVIRTGRQTSGKQRVSCSWDITTPGHTWTDRSRDAAAYDAYTIIDDPRHPEQEVAVSLDLVQGGPLFFRGRCWEVGRSGYHTRIRNLLEWIEDARGATGYDIQQQGSERILAPPRTFSSVQSIPPRLSSTGSAQVARFSSPPWIGGSRRACVELLGSIDNGAGFTIRLQVCVTSDDHPPQVVGILTIPPGSSDLSFRRWFDPGPTQTIEGRLIVIDLVGKGDGLSFAPENIASQAVLTLGQG